MYNYIMNKMDYKLIFFDLDDTLLRKDKSVSDKTLEVLRLLQKNGHKIIIDTARNEYMTSKVFDIIKPDYAIINAGALIINRDKKAIRRLVVEKEICRELISKLREHTNIISIQTDDILYEVDYKERPKREKLNLDGFLGMDAQKILVGELDPKVGKELAKEYNLDFENYFGSTWFRFCHIDATKMKAMLYITDIEKKELKDTIAFGDDYGDIGMIEASGVGVAMENGQDDVKRIASVMCDDCDNDGVARFLDKYFNLGIY